MPDSRYMPTSVDQMRPPVGTACRYVCTGQPDTLTNCNLQKCEPGARGPLRAVVKQTNWFSCLSELPIHRCSSDFANIRIDDIDIHMH